MRTPIESGLACIDTPAASSASKVSRALWPIASTTWRASMLLPSARVSPSMRRPPSRSRPTANDVTRAPNRYSPPSASICVRMRSTIVTSRKVPTCGLETVRISSGAPAATNSCSSLRP